jgi:hypothetical protein
MSCLPASFYVAEAARLRRLADDCNNPSLRLELLARAAEFEDLAMGSPDDDLVTREQAPKVR